MKIVHSLCSHCRTRSIFKLPECPAAIDEGREARCEHRFHVFAPVMWGCNFYEQDHEPMADIDTEAKPLFGELNGKPLRIPVIGFCGGKGSGKSFAGASLSPRETTEIAVEDSSITYNWPFPKSYSMYKEAKTSNSDGIPSPLECFLWFKEILPSVDTRILFIDPITDLQAGGYQYIVANCDKFGLTPQQCEKSSGLVWGALKNYFKILLGRTSQSNKLETLIFTQHMGTQWKDGKPTGKQKAKGVDTFLEIASLLIYLNRDINPQDGKQPAVPWALTGPPFGKNRLAATVEKEDGSWGASPILPPRMPEFTWTALRQYVEKPIDLKKLKKGEKFIQPELTEEQLLELRIEAAHAEESATQAKLALAQRADEAVERNAVANTGTSAVAPAEEPVAKPTPEPNVSTMGREEKIEVIKRQFEELGVETADAKAAIARRGAATLAGLSDEGLEDLRRALWNRLTAESIGGK